MAEPYLSLTNSLVADRFVVEAEIGRGGMGSVFRARDLLTGQPVAVKILHQRANRERFFQEAKLLATMSHPAILEYRAHGVALDGQAYLVTEWLEGEDLAQRLHGPGLRLSESLQLARGVAEALRVAHRQGIIHRDLKPGNLFLRAGQPSRPVLMDFGIAQRWGEQDGLTKTGHIIGTPQYMSPEQAQGEPVGPASDVFSLGCVLFECVTGQTPYPGELLAIVLGKLLGGEAPGLAQVRPELAGELAVLDGLLNRMLAKDLAVRLGDADALVEALDGIGSLPDFAAPVRQTTRLPAVAAAEQRLVSVMLALPPGACGTELATAELDMRTSSREAAPVSQLDTRALSLLLGMIGLRLEQLADGSLLASATADGDSQVDPVLRAARGAFMMKERWPQAQVVLATGRALMHQGIPQGEVMERIGQVLQQTQDAPMETTNYVLCDRVSGNLLETRYAMLRSGTLCLLQGELGMEQDSRGLLGKPTPCVGRERELALLDGLFEQSVQESVARAALVLAPAGGGKSRLRHEFIKRLHERRSNAQLVLARADLLNAGAAYGLLGEVLRQISGIVEGDPLGVRQEKLLGQVAAHCRAQDVVRVAKFLSEVCGCKLADDPELRLARQDPRVMATNIEHALVDFLSAQCQDRPLVIILEDLHWGDALTVRLIEQAIRTLGEQAFLVVALARPEVRDRFPNLWTGCDVQEVRLPPLSKKACGRLIEQVLGAAAGPDLQAKLVAQAGGNALLLEELIREASQGHVSEQPATVLAVLQGRIDRLEPEVRRVLRYASVYGEAFKRSGVDSILEQEYAPEEVAHWLELLCRDELIEARRASSLPEDQEYAFRHALVREAAYSLLTDEDRPRAHRAALEYLVGKEENDLLVLAGHAERSRQRDRAIGYYTAAAQQAFDCYDLPRVDEYAERAFACGAEGAARGELRSLQAQAAMYLPQWPRVRPLAEEAIPLVPAYGASWCMAQHTLIMASYVLSCQEDFTSLVLRFASYDPQPAGLPKYAYTCASVIGMAVQRGAMEVVTPLQRRVDELERFLLEDERLTRAVIYGSRFDMLRSTRVDPDQQVQCCQAALEILSNTPSAREYHIMTPYFGYAKAERGDFTNGAEIVRQAVRDAQACRDSFSVVFAQIHLASLLVMSEKEEYLAEAEELIEKLHQAPGISTSYQGWLYGLSGAVALQRGQTEAAELAARKGLDKLGSVPFRHLVFQAVLIEALRRQGNVAQAHREAEQALQALRRLSEQSYPAIPVLLEAAQTFAAAGDEAAAGSALSACLAEIRRRVSLIVDPVHRQQFLQGVRVHQRAFALRYNDCL